MIFRRHLAALIERDVKTQTRRIANDRPGSPWYHGKCAYRLDGPTKGIYSVQTNYAAPASLHFQLTETPRRERLGLMTDADARAEGALNLEDFKRIWCDINGKDSWKDNQLVWVLTFERVEV